MFWVPVADRPFSNSPCLVAVIRNREFPTDWKVGRLVDILLRPRMS
jgi:hypothetical protein